MTITIINGPNLNLQGSREPQLYGTTTFDTLMEQLQAAHPQHQFRYRQSNVEGELINYIQQAGHDAGIVINAGGYSHTSVALHDAITAVPAPVVEVHLSNIFARESYRHHSLLTAACCGMVCGLGMQGYLLAVDYLLQRTATTE